MHDKNLPKVPKNPWLQEGSHCLPLEVPNKKRSLKKETSPAEIPQKQGPWKAKEKRKRKVHFNLPLGQRKGSMQDKKEGNREHSSGSKF